MEEVWIVLGGVLSSIATGVVTWLTTKKKNKADINTQMIQDMKDALSFYKDLAESTNEKLNELLERNEELQKKNDSLEIEVKQLRFELAELNKKLNDENIL